MSGINQLLDQIEIDLFNKKTDNILKVHINVFDNSLSRKWLSALNVLLEKNYHLEKNYCFHGFIESDRNSKYLIEQINKSIGAINHANIGYQINDEFTIKNSITSGPIGDKLPGLKPNQDKFNHLHKCFEDLQGTSGNMSEYYNRADSTTRWHIRQLNLLCHEFESLVLSMRKAVSAPEWCRPSQLMCWLNAPRFILDANDYELFGIESLNRPLGGVFVGVNKAVGKHHFEVFQNEGSRSRVCELVTTALRSQTEASGDFDIEWANDPGKYHWQIKTLQDFRQWLIDNNFDPEDKTLTIGHPQIGQVDLIRSFDTYNYADIWKKLSDHLNVLNIRTSQQSATYTYNWSDSDYMEQQLAEINKDISNDFTSRR
jgi:hypothetical protein